MRKRMILMLAVVVVFIGAIGFVKFRQIQTAIAQGASWQPPPEAVTTVVAPQAQWPATLHSIGTAVAVHGVTVSADLPGMVAKISFESGRAVRAGEVLVELDTNQERAQLAAAQAERDLTTLNHERMLGLRGKGVASQAEYDRASAELKQAEARVREIEATIQRKTIRAPFAGVLGIRQVNLGQYLTSGDPVVPLQSLDPIYVNFSVPQQEVANLRVGADLRVSLEHSSETGGGAAAAGGDAATGQAPAGDAATAHDSNGQPSAEPAGAATAGASPAESHGKITAIDSIVDEATRNVQIQATLANSGGKLRPGMFVEVQAILGPGGRIVALPASAISYAPYGNSVFIVEEMKSPEGQPYQGVRQQFVKLGIARGDQVAIVSGITPGEEIVTSGVFKLRNGAAVLVNNEIQPGNSPAPEPEDS